MTKPFSIHNLINVLAGLNKAHKISISFETKPKTTPTVWFLYHPEDGLLINFSNKMKAIEPTVSTVLAFLHFCTDKNKPVIIQNADTGKLYRIIGFTEDATIENCVYILIDNLSTTYHLKKCKLMSTQWCANYVLPSFIALS